MCMVFNPGAQLKTHKVIIQKICIVDYIIIKLLYRVNIYRHTLYVIGHGCYSFITQ